MPVRLVRPEDGALLHELFHGLSERSRYQRFMQHLPGLSPQMIERFTRPARARELALAALDPGSGALVAVGRYAPDAEDRDCAEFALVVADAWQGRGIGRALLERLCEAARAAGYGALYGYILSDNREMLELAARLGFAPAGRDGAALRVRRGLR